MPVGYTGQATEGEIDQLIKNVGADKGRRITPQHIDGRIVREHYWRIPGTTTIICGLQLVNGFVVIGKAACASEANFNPEVGRKVAFDDARSKIWELEGYLLRQELYDQETIDEIRQSQSQLDLFDDKVGGA